jgi:hypothetical protein
LICQHGMQGETIELMREIGIPLTRENYLNLIFFGDIPDELDESEIPEMFRLPEHQSPQR